MPFAAHDLLRLPESAIFGRVTRHGAIRPGRAGEVMVEMGGGVQAFMACDADGGTIEPDEEVVLVARVAEWTVIVTRVHDRRASLPEESS